MMVYEALLTISCLCIIWHCLLYWVMNESGSTRISCEFFWGFILVISFWVTSHISLVLKCQVLETWLVWIIRKWHSYYRPHNFLMMVTEILDINSKLNMWVACEGFITVKLLWKLPIHISSSCYPLRIVGH